MEKVYFFLIDKNSRVFNVQYLSRVDAAFGDRSLVALVLDLVQQRANLLELGVAGFKVALLFGQTFHCNFYIR